MKIDQLWKAEVLVSERRKLQAAHLAATSCTIGVTVSGAYQDEGIVEAASPAVAAVFCVGR